MALNEYQAAIIAGVCLVALVGGFLLARSIW